MWNVVPLDGYRIENIRSLVWVLVRRPYSEYLTLPEVSIWPVWSYDYSPSRFIKHSILCWIDGDGTRRSVFESAYRSRQLWNGREVRWRLRWKARQKTVC